MRLPENTLHTPVSVPIPNVPQGLTASTFQTRSAVLNWTLPSPSTVDTYRVLRREIDLSLATPAPVAAYAVVGTVDGSTSFYTDSGLTVERSYEYALVAVNENGESDASASVRMHADTPLTGGTSYTFAFPGTATFRGGLDFVNGDFDDGDTYQFQAQPGAYEVEWTASGTYQVLFGITKVSDSSPVLLNGTESVLIVNMETVDFEIDEAGTYQVFVLPRTQNIPHTYDFTFRVPPPTPTHTPTPTTTPPLTVPAESVANLTVDSCGYDESEVMTVAVSWDAAPARHEYADFVEYRMGVTLNGDPLDATPLTTTSVTYRVAADTTIINTMAVSVAAGYGVDGTASVYTPDSTVQCVVQPIPTPTLTPSPTPIPPPGQPTGFSGSVSNQVNVLLEWTAPAGSLVDEFIISRREINLSLTTPAPVAAYTEIARVDGGVSTYTDTGRTVERSYQYQLVASNVSGSSAPVAASRVHMDLPTSGGRRRVNFPGTATYRGAFDFIGNDFDNGDIYRVTASVGNFEINVATTGTHRVVVIMSSVAGSRNVPINNLPIWSTGGGTGRFRIPTAGDYNVSLLPVTTNFGHAYTFSFDRQ